MSNLKGDFMGGLTTAVITLPWAIAFGIVAYAPLGDQYIAQGALAGLYSVIVSGLLASVLGGTTGLISLPTALQAVMTTSIITTILKNPEIAALGSNQVTVVLVLTAMAIAMAAIFQLILGASGGGKLVKFIPYPVIAGFMNGIAIIIFMGQLRPLFGVAKDASLIGIFTGAVPFRYDTLIVGAITIVAMLTTRKLTKAIPGSLVGLLCGVAAYFAIGNFFNPALLQITNNPLIIGPIPSAFPTPKQVAAFFSVTDVISPRLIGMLVVPALTLGILASIDTLLTSVVTDMFTRTKHNSVKELFAQGASNFSAAVFGGLPVAGSTLHALVNINAGGRTMLAGVFHSLIVLFIVLFLGSLVQWIPMAVLAGILLITAFTMVEAESINLSLKKSALGNLLVLVAVAAITVAVDLMIAVVVGLVITAFLFIKEQINKTIIRRTYTANLIHSKKIRNRDAMKILEEKGESIKVYELSGSIFFGTCDKLFAEMEKDFDCFCIILDFKRVHTIDLTGAQLLKQIIDRVKEKGNHVLLSYLDTGSLAEKSAPNSSSFDSAQDEAKALHGERSRTMRESDSGLFGQTSGNKDKQRLRRFMEDAGVIKAVGEDFIFADTDHAQEWAEDALIQKQQAAQVEEAKLDLSNFSIFSEFDAGQLETIRQHLHPLHFNKSDIVFKEGDPGDKIYFILSGGVSVLASVSDNGRARRLATFGEGVFFGDMAILEGKPRSATVRADSDTDLLYLSVDDFKHLVKNEPLIASKMLMGMAKELSYRLRLTSIEVRTLEE